VCVCVCNRRLTVGCGFWISHSDDDNVMDLTVLLPVDWYILTDVSEKRSYSIFGIKQSDAYALRECSPPKRRNYLSIDTKSRNNCISTYCSLPCYYYYYYYYYYVLSIHIKLCIHSQQVTRISPPLQNLQTPLGTGGLHLVSRLKMSGTIPILHRTPSWHA
jgi:hypothetical protein